MTAMLLAHQPHPAGAATICQPAPLLAEEGYKCGVTGTSECTTDPAKQKTCPSC